MELSELEEFNVAKLAFVCIWLRYGTGVISVELESVGEFAPRMRAEFESEAMLEAWRKKLARFPGIRIHDSPNELVLVVDALA